MSFYHQTHLLLETKQDGVFENTKEPRMRDHFACGEVASAKFYTSSSPEVEPTCPKCSAVWGKALLETLRQSGTVLTTERVDGTRYKSAYRVSLNGEAVAYALFPPGFRMTWRLHKLKLRGEALAMDAEDWPAKHSRLAVSRSAHSLNAAIATVPDLLAEGKLMTETQLRAEDAQSRAKWQEWQRKDAEDKARAKAALDEMLEGLRTILDRNDHGLTNFERVAVAEAYKRLAPKATKPDTSDEDDEAS